MVIPESLGYFVIFTGGDVNESEKLINLGFADVISGMGEGRVG